MNRVLSRLGLTAVSLVAGSALYAQGTQTGNLSGTVREAATNKPIAGANVTVHTPRGDRNVLTNANGEFRFYGLIPGDVTVSVSANGFVGGELPAHVALDATNILNFPLKAMSEATTTVTVIGSANNIDTTDAKAGKNFSLSEINNLPVTNRSVQNIASLSPGMSVDNNGTTIRGAQNTQVLYLVDGADVSDPVTGGYAAQLNEDMLSEVQVQSGGISAEYGRFTGGVIQAVTKSGTNDYSGIIRLTAVDPNWNAYNPLDRGRAGNITWPDTHTVTENFVFSGPIIKDHLFFVVGYRTRAPFAQSTASQTTAPAAFGGQIPYNATQTDERKDIKLDWQITPNHRVFWQYNSAEIDQTGRDYATAFFGGSTSLATLTNQPNRYSYYTLGYQGQLTDSLVLNAHYGHKKEALGGPGGGGQGGSALTMYDQVDNYLYDNGVFGSDADSRPIENATVSATWFLSAAGEHELKFGLDWYRSSHTAANAQSPSGVFVFFNGFINTNPDGSPAGGDTSLANRNFVAGTGGSGSFWDEWRTFGNARSQNTIWGAYINDKWKLNNKWSFNIGVRADKFESKNDLGVSNFSLTALSPRLAAIWDINGDGTWVAQASFGVYTGSVIQGATDSTSVVGNPAEYDFDYVSGPGNLRSSYSSTPFYVNDPGNYRHSNLFDPNTKMPEMQEVAFELKHADGQNGVWSIALNRRHWKNFIDDFKSAQPAPVDANDLSLTVLKNDPSLVRDYVGLELQYQKQYTEAFSFGGNMTLSTLKGNYEGGQVGTTDQVNNFGPDGAYPGAPTRFQLGDYGYLSADVPMRIRAFANYNQKLGIGRLNVGAIFSFTSGAPYSKTASNAPVLGAPSYIGGSKYTEYFSDRGALRFADTYRTDLQVGYELPIWRKFTFFTLLNITNVFNHQQLATWNTSGKTNGTGTVWSPANGFYGTATSASNYIGARAVQLSAGIKF